MVDILVSVCLIHSREPTVSARAPSKLSILSFPYLLTHVPASVGVEVAGVHQPDGVAGVVDVEVEGDAPHDDQLERQLQQLNNKTVMGERERGGSDLSGNCAAAALQHRVLKMRIKQCTMRKFPTRGSTRVEGFKDKQFFIWRKILQTESRPHLVGENDLPVAWENNPWFKPEH